MRSFLSVFLLVSLFAGCAVEETASPEARAALAPTGPLRVGLYLGSPTSAIRDSVSGEVRGVGYELGRELARRLEVPFEPIFFPRNAEVLEAIRSGDADVAFTNATPQRAATMDFTDPYLEMELGYLVPAGSPVSHAEEVDRAGVRVGVTEGGTSDGRLSTELTEATLLRARTLDIALAMLDGGEIDVFATNKAILFELADQLPGSRVLEGGYGVEQHAIAIPLGRGQGMPFLRRFAQDAMAEGLVDDAAERAGLRGTL